MEKTTSSGLAQEACTGGNSTSRAGCRASQRAVWALVWVDPLSRMIVKVSPRSAVRSSRTVVKAAESIRVRARRSAIVPVVASWVPYQATVPARRYSNSRRRRPSGPWLSGWQGVRTGNAVFSSRQITVRCPARASATAASIAAMRSSKCGSGFAVQPTAPQIHANCRLLTPPPHPAAAHRLPAARDRRGVDVLGQSGVGPRPPRPGRLAGGRGGDPTALLIAVDPRRTRTRQITQALQPALPIAVPPFDHRAGRAAHQPGGRPHPVLVEREDDQRAQRVALRAGGPVDTGDQYGTISLRQRRWKQHAHVHQRCCPHRLPISCTENFRSRALMLR